MNQPTNVTHLNRDPRTLGSVGGTAYQRPYERSVDSRGVTSQTDKKKFVAKGHDSQLQDAQYNKHPVKLTMMSGAVMRGTIARRDKYTITLHHTAGEDAGKDEIFYKHAIEGVLVDRVVTE